MTEFKKGQTVYLRRENTKLSNPPHTGTVHSVGNNHVVLRTGGGTGYYKARKDNLTHNSKESWLLSKKYTTEAASVEKHCSKCADQTGGGKTPHSIRNGNWHCGLCGHETPKKSYNTQKKRSMEDLIKKLSEEHLADNAVKTLESSLRNPLSYNSIDHIMQSISKKSNVSPKQLRDAFMKKHGKTPDNYAKGMSEAKDPREYGYEGEMVMSQLKGVIMHSKRLHDMLKPDTDLPEWVQSKITLAYDYIQTASDYMATELDEDAPVNAVGGGNVAGMGVDKPGKPGSGEPGVYKKKKKDLVLAPTMKRKALTDFMRGK